MNDERIAKIVLKGKVDGIKRKGRPRAAWMSAVEKRTGISLPRAEEQAQYREKKGHPECWSPRQTDTTQ